jgi:SOS-response transcriptional repressor LexA
MVQKAKNGLHDRIRQRIDELGLSEEAASLLVGTDRSYFRKLFERPNSHPRIDTLQRIAAALSADVAWLTTGASPLTAGDTENLLGPWLSAYSRGAAVDGQPADTPPLLPARAEMPLDVPVMGTAAGSHLRGAFQFEGGIVDYVRRPPALVGAKEIYGLYVEGSSMEPQYFPGDLIYVHPHRPPRTGDIVVVQCRNGEHAQGEATLGIYRRKTEKAFVIGKRNPPAEIEIAREHVTSVHRVLTVNELFGV